VNEQVIPFNQEIITELSEHRSEWLTSLFRFFSELGNVEGYLIIIALLFTVINKRLGIYASLVALFTIVINHLLKIAIKNPRPFVVSREYAEAWGVNEHRAAELIHEFSTPSGHAMTAAAFFGFLLFRIKNKLVRAACILTIIGIGLAHKSIDGFWQKWVSLSSIKTLIYTILFVAVIWGLVMLIENRSIVEYPLSIISILGFLSGTLLAAAQEEKLIGFSLEDSSFLQKIGRLVLMLIILMAAMVGFDWLFAQIAEDRTTAGLFLRYIRYFLVSVFGYLLASKLFVSLRLAKHREI